MKDKIKIENLENQIKLLELQLKESRINEAYLSNLITKII